MSANSLPTLRVSRYQGILLYAEHLTFALLCQKANTSQLHSESLTFWSLFKIG